MIRSMIVILFILSAAALTGCASHTELGGRRMGMTANWADPNGMSPYQP